MSGPPMPPMPPGMARSGPPMPPMPPGMSRSGPSMPPLPPGMAPTPPMVDPSRFPTPPGSAPPAASAYAPRGPAVPASHRAPYPPHGPPAFYPPPQPLSEPYPPHGHSYYGASGPRDGHYAPPRHFAPAPAASSGRYDPRGARPSARPYDDEPRPLREATNTVWVGNLDPIAHTDDTLRREFREFGKVMRIAKQAERSYCFVHFCRVEEARAAVETLSQRGTLGQAKFNYGKMFEYTPEEMSMPYDPDARPSFKRREDAMDSDRPARVPRHERAQMEPTNVLWVGSLPPIITDDKLHEAFDAFGTITLISRMDKGGMAFIHFETVEQCTLALQMMTGRPVDGGVVLALNYGHPQRSKTVNPADGMPTNEVPTNVVYLGQLPADAEEMDVVNLFSSFEGFINAKYIPSNNIGFGHFDTIEHAGAARVALHNATIKGTPIRVNYGKNNHNLTMADRRVGDPAEEINLDAMMRASPSAELNGLAGALTHSIQPGGGLDATSVALTLPSRGDMPGGGALAKPFLNPTEELFTKPRPVPEVTLDARLHSLLGTTYNNCGAKDLELSPSQVQAICTMVDDCVDEASEQRLDATLSLYAPLKAVHIFSVVAKRLHEYYNQDPHRKLLVLYAATRVLLGAQTTYVQFTTAALNAYLMVLLVASIGQTSSGMDRLSSILESLQHHDFVVTKVSSGAEYAASFRGQVDDIMSRAKAEQDLTSLLTKKKRR